MKTFRKNTIGNLWLILFVGYALWAFEAGMPVWEDTSNSYTHWVESVQP